MKLFSYFAWMLLFAGGVSAQETHDHHQHAASPPPGSVQESASSHVAPAPPTLIMPPMSAKEMIDIMAMDDNARFGKLIFNEAEWYDDGTFEWDLDGWYGSDYDKVWIKSAGEQGEQPEDHFSVEVLWDHAFARWWSVQSGIRREEREGEADTSLVLALQGLAPQWFEIEARLYVDEHGGVALHTEVDYDVLLTQRLVLQPDAKLTANSESDASRGVGSGLAEMEVGLRLRYELRREIAPYIGIRWVRNFGATADLARASGADDHDTQALLGLRFWF